MTISMAAEWMWLQNELAELHLLRSTDKTTEITRTLTSTVYPA